jgi:hypothetical protein
MISTDDLRAWLSAMRGRRSVRAASKGRRHHGARLFDAIGIHGSERAATLGLEPDSRSDFVRPHGSERARAAAGGARHPGPTFSAPLTRWALSANKAFGGEVMPNDPVDDLWPNRSPPR